VSRTFPTWHLFRISSFGFPVAGLTGLGLLCLMSQAALAMTSGSLALARTFDKTVVVTNSPILVMATLTNTSPDTLRGFFYFDELPSGLTVTNLSVTLSGLSLTNFSLESGLDGDVYAGCTPWRWRLETPTNFVEGNPLPPQGVVQIVFSISCASTGTFILQQFGCAACQPDKTNTLYGCNETNDQQAVTFVSALNTPPVLPVQTDRTLTGQQALLVTNTASDADIPANSLSYQLTEAPTGAAIDTNGVITWAPTVAQAPGTNVFTTVVTDYNPWAVNAQDLSATNSFRVVVNAIHNGPTLPAQTDLTIAELTTLTLINTAIDTDLPVLALTYSLINPPSGLTISSNGVISWTPSEAQGPGTNVITTIVTDNGTPPLSTTNSFIVVVNEINTPPVLPGQSDRTLMGQQALLVTNTASDADIPTNSLSYQLALAPAGAAIDTNGVITWTPTLAHMPGTNVFTTVVTDYNQWAVNAQHLSATNSFDVVVRAPPTPPEITSLHISNGLAVITWTSSAGIGYRVQCVENQTDTNWTDLQPDITASGPSAMATDAAGLLSQRFYRIVLVAP
jgi:uncharacterized repeat protein (TIGR01451 family)